MTSSEAHIVSIKVFPKGSLRRNLNTLKRKPEKQNQACRDSSLELCDTDAALALKPTELASKLGAGH